MTDPERVPASAVSASAAERLAGLRQPSSSKKRSKPARTSKILFAGISTTALFGMVAGMGWQAGTGTAQSASPPVLTTSTTQTPVPTAVTPTPTSAPLVSTPVPLAVPVPIPVAVPAVPTNNPRAQSNATTKSSG